MKAEATPRENNLEIAQVNIVNVKYALHALAADRTSDAGDRTRAAVMAAEAESLLDRIHALRFPTHKQDTLAEIRDEFPSVADDLKEGVPVSIVRERADEIMDGEELIGLTVLLDDLEDEG